MGDSFSLDKCLPDFVLVQLMLISLPCFLPQPVTINTLQQVCQADIIQ